VTRKKDSLDVREKKLTGINNYQSYEYMDIAWLEKNMATAMHKSSSELYNWL
jgi:hypothetical protein